MTADPYIEPETRSEPLWWPGPEKICDDTTDAPQLSGPIMPQRAVMLLPPWDFCLIARAYCEAKWAWSMNTEERVRFWKARGKVPECAMDCYLIEQDNGIIPNGERILKAVESHLFELGHNAGDYVQSGGLLLFRSKSGKLGLALESLLGEKYRAIKAERKDAP